MTSSAMLLVFFYSLRTGDFFVQNDELEKAGPHFCNPMRVTFFFGDSTSFSELCATDGQTAYDFSRFYVVLKKVSAKKCNPRGVTDKVRFFW